MSEAIFNGPRKKANIMYTILTAEGDIRVEHFSFLTRLMQLNSEPDYPALFAPAFVQGARPACLAHNVAVHKFMEIADADWLWIWADDMIPTESSLKLIELLDKADIICPSVRIWNGREQMPTTTVAFKEDVKWVYRFYNFHPTEDPYEPDACGTGGLLIHRRVFEDERMAVEKASGEDPAAYFVDEYVPCGRRLHGHDLHFTNRAKELGYKILVQPAAECDHMKHLSLDTVTRFAVRFHEMALEAEGGESAA